MAFFNLFFCIVVSFMTRSMAGILSRTVGEIRHPPCFSAKEQCNPANNEPITNATLVRYLNDLEPKIVGAKYVAEDIKPYIEDRWYVLHVPTDKENITQEIENEMGQYRNDGMPHFCSNTHIAYERLNELANYIETLLRNESGLMNSDIERSMNNKFTDWQKDIYRCMCEMKRILRSLNCEPCTSVPSGHFSDYFQSRATTEYRVDQMMAAYWVVLRGISDLTCIRDYLVDARQYIN